MGYQIQYGQTMKRKVIHDQKNKINSTTPIRWVVMGLIVMLGIFLGNSGYLDFLIPGNKDVTTAAFESMVQEVKNGEKIKDAVTGFCLEILKGSNGIS